jgi:hypothetical protein
MITIIDFVNHGNNEVTNQFQCCYFELHTLIYDSSKTDHIDFTLIATLIMTIDELKFVYHLLNSFVAIIVKIAN